MTRAEGAPGEGAEGAHPYARASARPPVVGEDGRTDVRAAVVTEPGRTGRSERASERARDKPLCRGLTFNRSQRGSCSATYETLTQKQVVYEWFSARFHTNVRCDVTGERAAPFPAAPRLPGRTALRTGTPVPTRGGADPAGGDGRGSRLSEANRGSLGAAVSFRLGGILT